MPVVPIGVRGGPSIRVLSISIHFYPFLSISIQNLERPPRGRHRRIVRDIPSPRAKLSPGPSGRTRRRTRQYSRTRGGAIESIGNNYIELLVAEANLSKRVLGRVEPDVACL